MAEFGPDSPLSDDGCKPVQPAVNWVTMGLLLFPWGPAAEHSDLLVFPGITSGTKGADLPRAVAFLQQPRLIKGAVAALICVPALTICTVFEFHGTCRMKLSKLAIYKERSQLPGSSLQLIYSL